MSAVSGRMQSQDFIAVHSRTHPKMRGKCLTKLVVITSHYIPEPRAEMYFRYLSNYGFSTGELKSNNTNNCKMVIFALLSVTRQVRLLHSIQWNETILSICIRHPRHYLGTINERHQMFVPYYLQARTRGWLNLPVRDQTESTSLC